MLLHDLALLGRERAALGEDRGRHADLAERMEERRVAEVAKHVVAEPEALAERDRVRRDAALMVLVIAVTRLDHRGELRDRRQVRVVELAVQAHRADRRCTHAGEDADELTLVVGEPVRLGPRDQQQPDGFRGRAQRLNEERAVAPLAHPRPGRLGRLLGIGELDRPAGLERDHEVARRRLRERELPRPPAGGITGELEGLAAGVQVDRRRRCADRGHERVGEQLDDVLHPPLAVDLDTGAVEIDESLRETARARV